jgi:cytochrome P450
MSQPGFDPKSLTTAEITNPYPLYRRYRETEPVHYSPTTRAWYIFSYRNVFTVLSSRDFGRGETVIPTGYDTLRRVVGTVPFVTNPTTVTAIRLA